MTLWLVPAQFWLDSGWVAGCGKQQRPSDDDIQSVLDQFDETTGFLDPSQHFKSLSQQTPDKGQAGRDVCVATPAKPKGSAKEKPTELSPAAESSKKTRVSVAMPSPSLKAASSTPSCSWATPSKPKGSLKEAPGPADSTLPATSPKKDKKIKDKEKKVSKTPHGKVKKDHKTKK